MIVNPIAGLGAKLAWKGTDDINRAWKLILDGNESESLSIAKRALASVEVKNYEWVTVNGEFEQLGKMPYRMPVPSTEDHTKEATKKIIEEGVDLIVFVGGDGTAADVAKIAYPSQIPIIGVPAGVKIFSGAFLHRPEDLGQLLKKWMGEVKVVDIEDLDEEAYRNGMVIPKTITAAYVPIFDRIQEGKSTFHGTNGIDVFESIAQRIEDEDLLKGTILAGGGSTLYEIFRALGLKKSLLGVDVFRNGQIILEDATYDDLLTIEIDEIWLTPIGRQGHLFGRGNRQIPPKVIEQVGKQRIKIFATPEKMQNTPMLYIDSGDPKLDQKLKGYYKVIVGFHDTVVRKAE